MLLYGPCRPTQTNSTPQGGGRRRVSPSLGWGARPLALAHSWTMNRVVEIGRLSGQNRMSGYPGASQFTDLANAPLLDMPPSPKGIGWAPLNRIPYQVCDSGKESLLRRLSGQIPWAGYCSLFYKVSFCQILRNPMLMVDSSLSDPSSSFKFTIL